MYFNFFASVWMKVWSIVYLPWKTTTPLWNTDHTLEVWTLLLPYSLKTRGTKLDSTACKIIRPASIFSSFVQHLMLRGLVSVPHTTHRSVCGGGEKWLRFFLLDFVGHCSTCTLYFWCQPIHQLISMLPSCTHSNRDKHSGTPGCLSIYV